MPIIIISKDMEVNRDTDKTLYVLAMFRQFSFLPTRFPFLDIH